MTRELLNGLLLGGLYAAIGLGVTIVAGVMKVVNLAHGEFLMVAAYLVGFVNTQWGWDPLLATVVVAPAMAVAVYPVQRLIITPTMRHGFEPALVATFGIGIAVQTLLVIWFTSNPRSLSASYATAGVTIFGTTVRVVLVIALAIGLALALLVQLFMVRTPFGRELRAASEDPVAAATVGVNVGHVYGLALSMSAFIACFGGALIAMTFSYAPTGGLGWLLRAFTVAVIGGLGSVPGVIIGGAVLGLSEEFGAAWFGPQYRDVVVFLTLAALLVARPQGMLGHRATG